MREIFRGWYWKLAILVLVAYAGNVAQAVLEAPSTAASADGDLKAIQEKAAKALASTSVQLNTIWTLVAGMLVFFMGAGFACVEAGFCRAKNCVNIMSKNFIVVASSTLAFWFLGWGIMFGDGNGFMGTSGIFGVTGLDTSPLTGDEGYLGVYSAINWSATPLWCKFFFQLVFCATAATIVSGVCCERIKYGSFILFSFIMGIVIYPVVGHWIWGGGFLAGNLGFWDFAGSTQVHSIGGWAGLAGAIMLGPRLGKYSQDGKLQAIPGHSLSLATLGCFILWLGWFGFNPGSTMGADAGEIADICVMTNLAAAAGALSATFVSWLRMGKPDLGMTLNGSLAGLVAITAPCAWVGAGSSIIIGVIAGILVVFSVGFFDKIKIDDPVGALSVHLTNGIWGTLAVGLFASTAYGADPEGGAGPMPGLFAGGGIGQLLNQLFSVLIVGGYVLVLSFILWGVLKATLGIRVSPEEESQGLDIGEHGQEAYGGFQMISK